MPRKKKKVLTNNQVVDSLPWKSLGKRILLDKDTDVSPIYERLAQFFVLIPYQRRKKRRKRNEKNIRYKDCICAFDIESTNDEEIREAFMYIWQFTLWSYKHRVTVLGRTWQQFLDLLRYLKRDLEDDDRVFVGVHNLDYEFSFLAGVYNFGADDVFCLDKRRIGYCNIYGHFELRCTYKLTNLSLSTWCKQMNVRHKKQDGAKFDYSIYRTPGRALRAHELRYCEYDTVSVCECLAEKLRREDDDLYTVPLTSTGYVRREARKVWNTLHYAWRREIQPDLPLLDALLDAFRGGNVHGNRLFMQEIVENVHSADRSSSYIDVLMNHPYPGGKMWNTGPLTTDDLLHKINVNKLAILMRVRLMGLHLKDRLESNPYIATAKTIHGEEVFEDNGRILSIPDSDYIEMCITDVDLRIICDQYEWKKFEVLDSWCTTYKPLPDVLKQLLIKYYRLKTELKGVEGSEALYLSSKEKLNSVYGMMVQNPLRPRIQYVKDNPEEPYIEKYEDREKRLESYNKKGFLPMQFGVWCTAWARWELQVGIKNIERQGGYNVYSDTDSCKFIDGGNEISWTDYNDKKIRQAMQTGAYADDPSGERHYMGVFELEDTMDRFISLGAKKYVGEKNGHIKLTISGVPKKKGALEVERKGGLDNIKPGFVFEDAGLAVLYNDYSDYWISRNGERIKITSNTYLYTDTYVVGMTPEYEEAIRIAKQLLTEDGPFAILGYITIFK